MDYKDLAELIFPHIKKTVDDYEKIYPKRDLKEGAIVTRYAPSPTGFIHIGALLASFTESSYAHQTGGVFYLRIEDTDTKRTIENGINEIIDGLKEYNVNFDEGPVSETEENGNYGPYIQSKRKDIYQAFIKHLVILGKAYPCFCSPEKLDEIRKSQTERKARLGYYGRYAKCRNISVEDAIKKIKAGEPYVIRLKSPGDFNNKIECVDEIRGKIIMPENDIDIVIMKSDGLPTYHFAHLVDDHLMRTTHVIRADEWLSSLPLHLQLFDTFGFERPKYCHISPLLKNDNGSIRKLSKRKDPELAMSYYSEVGMPMEAVMEYLATITSSEYEAWHAKNPDKISSDYEFKFNKMNKSGALFDLEKMFNLAKTYISKLKAEDLYNRVEKYLEIYDPEFLKFFAKNKNYSISLLNIEREQAKPRKDIALYSDVKKEFLYMYDELFDKNEPYHFQTINDTKEIKNILNTYINKYYDELDDKDTWFNKMKELSGELGYAKEVKDYKENPCKYKGHVGDVSMVIRVAITKRNMTPDLYQIMQLLGKERISKRIELMNR